MDNSGVTFQFTPNETVIIFNIIVNYTTNDFYIITINDL